MLLTLSFTFGRVSAPCIGSQRYLVLVVTGLCENLLLYQP
jgi:hypothetical protein